LIPLLLLIGPPTTTSVITSVSVTSIARKLIRPSSIKIASPGLTSPGSPLYVVEQRSTVPWMSSVVIANLAPSARRSFRPRPAQPDLRSLQIGDTPTGRPAAAAFRTFQVRQVIGIVAVAHVESSHIHPGFDQLR
jgi:hypothetical protein